MKKIIIFLVGFITAIFLGIFLWDYVPYANKIMRTTAGYGQGIAKKSYKIARQVSGLEKLEVLERSFSPDQARKLFSEYSENNTHVELCFFPHSLMVVKFSKGDVRSVTSQEGTVLWSLVNGEMVLDTVSWACSKGFKECLLLKADRQDLQVIQALAGLGGSTTKDALIQTLSIKSEKAEKAVRDCQRKKLIFAYGNRISSHFQHLQPIQGCTTAMHKSTVWLHKPRGVEIVPANYQEDRIKQLVSTIFGENFFIMKSGIIYVPVYKVFLTSPDESIRIEYVNAVTGKVMDAF